MGGSCAITRVAVASVTIACATIAPSAGEARADEPVLPSEPKVMREPGERVDVIDAFDEKDPIDVDVGLGFAFALDRGTLSRDGRAVANWSRSASRLTPRITVGLFRDVSFGASMSILLDESVDIDAEGGGAFTSSTGDTLIALPFRGPSRSGFERVTVEAAAAPLNQMRGAPLSLKVALLGHLSAFSARHPCDAGRCARLVAAGALPDPGTTTGLLGGELAVTVARRFLSVEPWARVAGRLDVAVEGALKDVSDAGGALPKTFSAAVGTMIIPWENRESFGRVTMDFGVGVTVESAGFSFDVLTDALGTSAWGPIADASPRWSGLLAGGTRVVGRITTEGLWQASRFVKLGLGFNGSYEASRDLSGGDEQIGVPSEVRAELARPIVSSAVFAFDLSSRGVVMF